MKLQPSRRKSCVHHLGICSTPVLPQQHVKDPGHSAKSVGGRLQLNTNAPYVCGFAWSDMVHGCIHGVYKTRRNGSNFMCHQPWQHFGGYSKTRYKKLFIHVESHSSVVSLLGSGEQRHIKAIINSNNYNNKKWRSNKNDTKKSKCNTKDRNRIQCSYSYRILTSCQTYTVNSLDSHK